MKTYKLDGEIASFDFHDASGFWAFCGPKSLNDFLAELKEDEPAEIEINSPGGSVIAGMAMANAIKNSKAKITAHISGLCASMATVVACACDEIKIEEASLWMIHNPWSSAEGNADELRKQAAILDQMKEIMIGFYRGKFSGVPEERLAELMADETWYTATECEANGLDCEVIPTATKYAAKLTTTDLAAAPDTVKAFFASAKPTDEIAKMLAAPSAPQVGGAVPCAPSAPQVGGAVPCAPFTPTNWEARFKGASKKINELTERLAAQQKSALDLCANFEAGNKDLKSQLEKANADLATAKANASEQLAQLDALKEAKAKADAELAQCRDTLAKAQAEATHLRETRALLTAGVLTPAEEALTYDQKLAAAKTPEARENLRRQKATGKIN